MYPSECSLLLVVITLTSFLVTLFHFLVKLFAVARRSCFTNLSKLRSSIGVVTGGLPERGGVFTFPRTRNLLRIVAIVPRGHFVSVATFDIESPPLASPTTYDRSSSVSSLLRPIVLTQTSCQFRRDTVHPHIKNHYSVKIVGYANFFPLRKESMTKRQAAIL